MSSDPNECGRCNGSGDVVVNHRVQTCPVCHGSTLSSAGEARLWRSKEARVDEAPSREAGGKSE